MSNNIIEKAKNLITYKAMTIVFGALFMVSVLTNIVGNQENNTQLVNAGGGKMLLALDIDLDEIIELGEVVELGQIIELGKVIDLDEVIQVDQVIDLDNIIEINNILDLQEVFELSNIIEIEEIIEIEDVIEIEELMNDELTTSLESESLGLKTEEFTPITA